MTAPARPIIRYHGGKWKHAREIIAHMPPHTMYVEPFGGAASVLLQKSPVKCEVYNDLDEELVNLFRVLRDPVQARKLARALELTPYARLEFVRAYEPTTDPVERARRAVIRSSMGQGSDAFHRGYKPGFRAKRAGDNSPAHDFANYPQHLAAFVKRLRYVVIENMPALACIAAYDSSQTLFYLDPPYVHSTRTQARTGSGYRHEMTDADHEALAERLHAVAGMVVLSGYDSPLYRHLYPDWPVFRRQVMADKAVPRTECLWLSPRTVARLNRRSTLMEMAG